MKRKVAWLKWDTLCSSRKDGGARFKDLQSFKTTLLYKWIWRFIGENERLWTRVKRSRHRELKVRQGGAAESSRRGGRNGWWMRVVTAVEGNVGGWSWDNVQMLLGDGRVCKFWSNPLIGDKTLMELFPRFNLSSNKDGSVHDMGTWIGTVGIGNFDGGEEFLKRKRGELKNCMSSYKMFV